MVNNKIVLVPVPNPFGNSARKMAERVAEKLKGKGEKNVAINSPKLVVFSSTEMKLLLPESVREKKVYVIYYPLEPDMFLLSNQLGGGLPFVAMNNMIAVELVRLLKVTGSAERVVMISPYLPDARQDHRRGRENVAAADFINLLEENGVERLVAFDLHSEQIVGFGKAIHIDNLRPWRPLIDKFKALYPNYAEDFVLLSPDEGAVKRCRVINSLLSLPMAVAYKHRDYSKTSTVKNIEVLGSLDRERVVIIDDIVDTAGTISALIKNIVENYGERKFVVMATHAVLSGKGVERLKGLADEGLLEAFITTDSIMRDIYSINIMGWYHIVSLDELISKMILAIHRGESISEVYLESFEAF